jgi:type VI secretion system protein
MLRQQSRPDPDSRRSISGRSATRRLLLLSLPLLVGGCGMMPKMSPDANVSTVTLSASPDANDGFPVPVDIVVVRTDGLVGTVGALAARDWFAKRDQMRKDAADRMSVWSFEIVAGRTQAPFSISRSDRWDAKGIFVFANYIAPGDHRLRIDTLDRADVVLGPRDLSAAPSAK